MEEKYRKMFFRYIYNYLNLSEEEENFNAAGINYIQNEGNMTKNQKDSLDISRFYYLLNDIDLDKLTEDELSYLNAKSNDEIDAVTKIFLEKTYERVLLRHTDDKELFFGPEGNYNYVASNDSIVIGCKYDRFGYDRGSNINEETRRKNEILMVKSANMIQMTKNKDYKIDIIIHDEISEKIESLQMKI